MTKFGQSLEFSDGLFSNLNIETQREAARKQREAKAAILRMRRRQLIPPVKPEVVIFTVKANFGSRRRRNHNRAPAPTQQVAMKNSLNEDTEMKVGKLPSFPWYLRLVAFLAIGGVLYAGFWYFVTSGTRKATKEMEDRDRATATAQRSGGDRSAEPQQLQSRVQSA